MVAALLCNLRVVTMYLWKLDHVFELFWCLAIRTARNFSQLTTYYLSIYFCLGEDTNCQIPITLKYGVGKHTLAVIMDLSRAAKAHPPLAALTLIVLPITQFFAVTFSKLAILDLPLQMFKFHISRYITYFVVAVVLLQCTVCTVVTLMQCQPTSLVWSSTIREQCIDLRAFLRFSTIPNVTTDLIMLLIPLPRFRKLNAPMRVKVGITIRILTAPI